MAKSNASRNCEQPENGKAPDGFLHFLWVIRNWRQYWREFIGFAIFFAVLFLFGQGVKIGYDLIRSHFSSVTMRVLHFNHSTGAITLEFNNMTRSPVPVDTAYITIAPTNSAPMKPLPAEFQRLISVFDKGVFRVPGGASIEIGKDIGTDGRRLIRSAVLLTRLNLPFVLPPGVTSTNLVPSAKTFIDICDQYAEGAELEVILHTSLVDQKGLMRTKEFVVGNYFLGKQYSGVKGMTHPKEIDVLRGGMLSGRTSERGEYKGVGTFEFPPLDDKVEYAIFENVSPFEVLVKISERISGLIPVVLVKSTIIYGCHFSVELINNEKLTADFDKWILTLDEGRTVMNIPMAFSNSWLNVHATPNLGKEYVVPLPSTNWHVLVDGQRWAQIRKGAVKVIVKEESWVKLLPANDVTTSTILSNYNRIAFQEIRDDPSWVPVTNSPIVTGNSGRVIIVKNEITPDLSMFSNLRLPDSSETNVITGKMSDIQRSP